jgi:glucose uptake protein
MILPHTDFAVLLVMLLGLLCWGSWANTFKLAGNLRFELFYYDFALGVLATAGICACTAGSMGFDGFTVMDDLLNASKHQILYGVAAGALFNFGNMLLMAAVAVAGMTLAFPVSFGIAMVIGGGLTFLLNPAGQPSFLLLGGSLLVMAAILDTLAHGRLRTLRHETLAKAGKAKSTRRPTGGKGAALAALGGLLMGTAYPLLAKAQDVNTGLGPYATGLVLAVGVFGATLVLNMYFINLPVEGEPLELDDFFRTTIRQHLLGILGGALWFAGLFAILLTTSPRADLHPNQAIGYGLAQGAPVLAALWGILIWKDLRNADSRADLLATLTLVLFVLGLALAALAQLPAAA